MKIGLFCKKSDKKAKDKAMEFKLKSGFDCEFLDEVCDFVDLIVTFGGDGTVLHAVKYAIKFNAPIISVHMGHLGFLCAYSSENLDDLYQAIRFGKVNFDDKLLIHGQFNDIEFYSFNEVVVQREIGCNSIGTATRLELYINEDFADDYLSDGIIIATPSGSTAYSLSAGGAVLTPELNGFITTAICPHSLHNRSIVFGSENIAKVVVKKSEKPCKVYSDGVYIGDISVGQNLICTKAKIKVKISVNESYFSKLNRKLRFWGNGG